ncbi:transmembrane channel-like protein 7 [Astyanax mexicanus]|uniref:transmembrane channel-like protein 7 n=1 Tax=Astyanax mexicanus TaxID=7994 RepID=UPI0020CB20C0|nr:transmembrane channel-like protein 7 [Astyanax mexicanus]
MELREFDGSQPEGTFYNDFPDPYGPKVHQHISNFDDDYSPQSSLRYRGPTVPQENTTAVQFDWSSRPDESGDEESHQPQNLRELPLHMGLKRAIWQVQQMRVPVVTRWGSWRIHQHKAFLRFWEDAKDVLAKVVLWRKTTHKIGGHFGGGVQSYFLFLRFLVVLNFLSFLLMAGFVIIPSIVFHSIANISSSIDLLPTVNLTRVGVCLRYDHTPDALTAFYTYFLDLLSGTGFMEYSYMFYGFYNNTMVISSGFSYNVPLAYLLTAAFYFLFCLTCIIVRMGSVTQVMVAAGGAAAGGYSALIFTGWDYGLQGERATTLKQKNLRYQLQVDLEEERINKMAASLTLTQTVGLYSLRTFLQLVVLAMIGGAFLGIAAATQFSQSQQQQGFVGLLLEYLPSIVITTSNFVVPMLCDKVALFEKYSPSTTIILALLRAVFLRLVSLGVLLYTLWNQITCNGDVSDRSTTDCATCSYNNLQYQCWETRVGQEMYKLTLFDFLITIAMLVFVEFPRRMVVDHCSCKLAQWVGRQEFLVPTNVLALVYGQTVVWTGALFCPLLPLINTVKFIIIFYCKKITLFQNCRPALRTFRSTSSSFFFFLVLLFGWGLSSVVLVYSVATIHPSYGCGPFRFSPTMWSVVPKSFHSLSNTTQEFLLYVGSQAFSIPLFISSCVFLCYVAALASVYGKTVALLKNQYKMEGRDKQFLVKQIKELSTGLPKEEQEQEPKTQQPQREGQAQWDTTPHWREQQNPAFEPEEEMMTEPSAFYRDDLEHHSLHYREG